LLMSSALHSSFVVLPEDGLTGWTCLEHSKICFTASSQIFESKPLAEAIRLDSDDDTCCASSCKLFDSV